jgi:HAD superfamily hydrolase (TIGR01459 family)
MMISFFQRFTTSFSGVPSTKSRILSPLRSFNLLLETPVQLRDIKEIATRYEIFLFDQFGVIHDGDAPLPGALEVLRYLQAARKTVVIISNTSSREKEATDKLQKLGIPQYLFDGGITTSGESAHNWIICEENAKKCCWFAWENYQSNSFLRDLDVAVTSVDDADFLLFQGTQRIVTGRNDMTAATPISLFETGHIDDSVKKLLSIAASRNLPAVCANIDFTAVTAAGTAYMPGMLMTAYEELGGICFAFGKPDAGHFKNAFEKASVIHRIKLGLSESTKLRAIHIGDSILHDIAGKVKEEANIPVALLYMIFYLIYYLKARRPHA